MTALDSLRSRYLITVPAITVPLALILLKTKGYYIGRHLTSDNDIKSDKTVLAVIAIVAKLQVHLSKLPRWIVLLMTISGHLHDCLLLEPSNSSYKLENSAQGLSKRLRRLPPALGVAKEILPSLQQEQKSLVCCFVLLGCHFGRCCWLCNHQPYVS